MLLNARTALLSLLVGLGACLHVLPPNAAHAQAQPQDPVVVIVHKDNPNTVDTVFVQRAYLGAVKGWPDGSPLLVFEHAEASEPREKFYADTLRKSPANVKAIWAQNIFTGKGYPPKVLASDAEMKRIVASNLHAIGYIHRSQLDASVRALPP